MSIEAEEDFVQTTDEVIKDRLLHVLTIYPRISPSMLQVGIGTAISPKMWHPVMKALREQGIVVEEETAAKAPNGRDLNYKHLSVAPRELWSITLPQAPKVIGPNMGYTGGLCSECREPQFETPSGVTCTNGHGGADPLEV